MSYDLKAPLSAAPDDLTAAAKAARYLASTVASIRGLSDTENARKRLTAELADNYEAARAAIRSVTPELRLTRAGAVRLGDIVAPTAHEAAVEMVFALNRERVPYIEIIGREPVRVWPDVREVLAEIDLETARARDRRDPGSATSTPQTEPGKQPVESATTAAKSPKKLLAGWHQITSALDMRYNQRHDIKSLNQRFKGPIVSQGAGTKPMVHLDTLLDWWNKLAIQEQEVANRREGARLSAEAHHDYGRKGTVAPEIGGGVKERRKDRRT
jgi:hypothetical protein